MSAFLPRYFFGVAFIGAAAVFSACTGVIGVAEKEGAGGVGGGAGAGSGSTSGAGGASGTGSSSTGSSSTGSSSTGSSSTGSTGSSGAASSSSGGQPMCNPPCAGNEYCEVATLTCVCDPGFVMQGGSCVAVPPGDPSTRTSQEVCDAWANGHVVTTPNPFMSSGAACDAGTLAQGAFVDTLARMNMFRWLSGLGPTTDDPGFDADAQKCANLESWWDFSNPNSPHSPPAGVKCYTPEGAASAGQSNIAWGSGSPAQAIDQFMQDNGNATTMGHRRWIVNPPLGPVGIGYWEGGGMYGNAECLRVFGMQGGGPNPPWSAVPNQGFVPIEIAQWTWTFHGSLSGIPNAGVAVLRVDDNTPLAVTIKKLSQGYGQDAISWTPSGWSPQAGFTYRVTISGLGGGDVVYDVKPVVCN